MPPVDDAEGPSIADDLRAAFQADASSEAATPDPAAEPAPEAPVEAAAEAAPVETEEEPAEPADGEHETTETGALKAHSRWSNEIKDEFSRHPPTVQKWMLDRQRDFDRRWNEKAKPLTEERKTYEAAKPRLDALDRVLTPYRAMIERGGVSETQALENIARLNEFYERDPKGYVKWVAEQSGINLAELAGTAKQPAPQPDPDDEYLDPAVKAIRDQNRELTTRLQQIEQQTGQFQKTWQQSAQQQEQSRLVGEMTRFAEAKGEDGKPLRPYFGDVIEDMIRLARGVAATGQRPDLNTIYDQAAWANPTTRDRMLRDREAAATAAARQKAIKDKTDASRSAAVSLPGTPGAPGRVTPQEPGSVRESVIAAARHHGAPV